MAKLRSATCYRKSKKPYTRVSKYREKSYVKGVPGSKIKMFDMGDLSGKFSHKLLLKSKEGKVQIRHNALEAARMAANKYLEVNIGRAGYLFKVLIYPHQVMRFNPQANFAGADRFTTGMAHTYGKTLGRAAQVKAGQNLMYVMLNEKNLKKAKEALRRAGNKLPVEWELELVKL